MALLPHNSTVTAVQRKTEAEIREEIQAAAREIRDQVRQQLQAQRQRREQPERQERPEPPERPESQPATTPPPAPGIMIHPPSGDRGSIIVGGSEIPWDPNQAIPPQAVDISIAFFLTIAAIIIGLPISRAFARRMDRKAAPSAIPREVSSQLEQLAQSVDAIALEVERISEGQRFTTKLLSEVAGQGESNRLSPGKPADRST